MKKFSKLFALSLAVALTFGMTVHAESPDTENTKNETITASTDVADSTEFKEEITDANGNVVDKADVKVVASEATASVKNTAENNPDSYLEQTPGLSDYQATGKAVAKEFDLKANGVNVDYSNAVNGKLTFTTTVAEANFAGRAIAIHLGAGGPEYAGDNGGSGANYTLTVSDLSPIVFIPVDTKDDGDDDDDDDDDDTPAAVTTSVATSTGVAASPKTGETMPVAVLFAAASLGAAAVCARKARYNK